MDGDNHYRIADRYVEAAKLQFIEHVKPDVHMNLGDQYDLHSISRFEKEPERVFDKFTLQDEFDSAFEYWKRITKAAKRVEFILGNHEYRLTKLIMANAGLFGLACLNWHTMAGIPSSVHIHPYGAQRQIGLAWFEHGDQFASGRVGPGIFARRGGRVQVYGHSHMAQFLTTSLRDERGRIIDRVVMNTGHGSDLRYQTYAGATPNWQHAFGYIQHHSAAGRTDVATYLIRVQNGRIFWDGKVFDGGRPHTKRKAR